jgi:hypothetical protein
MVIEMEMEDEMTSQLTAKQSCFKPSRVVSGRILAAAPLST